eukprot:TRINITY_DN6809_c0_g1_i1.p1 TRINITY_DN6809_c0_g1~~TRINITY_DN6809_c0_g1_i1.p1  ORF type:complete len:437 (+),score=125.13 TRINITY_DN6809_c0_g1_i1:39-1313(+)
MAETRVAFDGLPATPTTKQVNAYPASAPESSAKMHRTPRSPQASSGLRSPRCSGLRSPASSPRFSLRDSRRNFRASIRSQTSRLFEDDSTVDLRTRSGFGSEDFQSDAAGSISSAGGRRSRVCFGDRPLTAPLLSPKQRLRRHANDSLEKYAQRSNVLTRRRLLEQNLRFQKQKDAADRDELRERARHLRQTRRQIESQERALQRALRQADVRMRHNTVERRRLYECTSIAAESAQRCASAVALSQCQRKRTSEERRASSLCKRNEAEVEKEMTRKLRQKEHRRALAEKAAAEARQAAVRRRERENSEAVRVRRIEDDHHRAEMQRMIVEQAKQDYATQLRVQRKLDDEARSEARTIVAEQRSMSAVVASPRVPPRVRPDIPDDLYARLTAGRYSRARHADPFTSAMPPAQPKFAPRWKPPSSS